MKLYFILVVALLSCETYSKETLVQKVVYSEASPLVASDFERYLIISVIKNRINNKHFSHGRFDSVNDVLKARNAFTSVSCRNSNWYASKCAKTLNKINKLLNKKPYPDITLYHDRSISKPKHWQNVVKVCETENFIFYKIKKG